MSLELFDKYRQDMLNGLYCEENMPNDRGSSCSTEHFLEAWKQGKSKYLTTLMGGQHMILTQEVEFHRSTDGLTEAMNDMVEEHRNFIDTLLHNLREDLGFLGSSWILYDDSRRHFYAEIEWLLQGYQLAREARVSENVTAVLRGKEVRLSSGQKAMRALAQIAKIYDMKDEYERFRIAHSQVLNVRTLKGEMCLSIHPLDYATASDNNNGWSSCMSWREAGCYRMGTIEMMTSPMVICAYLKSNSTAMKIGDNEEWNSKKWRAWIIVTKDAILCNRNYPYDNADLAQTAIKWVRALAEQNLGWHYSDSIESLGMRYLCTYHTDLMYNDVSDECFVCYRTGLQEDIDRAININYSGPAICLHCGSELSVYDNEADTLLCEECRVAPYDYYCVHCSEGLYEDDVVITESGDAYCQHCFDELFDRCDWCDEFEYKGEFKKVNMAISGIPSSSPHHNRWLLNAWSEYWRTYCDEAADKHWVIPVVMVRPQSTSSIMVCANCLESMVNDEHEVPWLVRNVEFADGSIAPYSWFINPRLTFEQLKDTPFYNLFFSICRYYGDVSTIAEGYYRFVWEMYQRNIVSCDEVTESSY